MKAIDSTFKSKVVTKCSLGIVLGLAIGSLGITTLFGHCLSYPSSHDHDEDCCRGGEHKACSGATKLSKNNPNSYSSKEAEHKGSKFAVISGFVTKESESPRPRIENKFLPHLINKACYCELWGYDYIFNQTWGFPEEVRSAADHDESTDGAHWLDYGTWHRVPHIVAAMDAGYEWVLYADIDYVFQDIALPLEAFLKQWEHYGKQNVHVFLPDDDNDLFTFSAFAVMVRNSDFGRKLLENWLTFSKGMCPKGNFPTTPGKYVWTDSDQPGLWYALAKTHHDFCPEQGGGFEVKCTEKGYLNTSRFMGPELNNYMKKVRAIKSKDLSKVPNDQPIIWSRTDLGVFARSGLGVQLTFGRTDDEEFPHAFALHKKNKLPKTILSSIDRCQDIHGCVANYTENGKLDIHCRNGTHVIVVGPGSQIVE